MTAETKKRVSVRYDGAEEDRYLGYYYEEEGRVRYDDGEEQDSVKPEWVTYVAPVTPADACLGLRVEARIPDDTRVFPGEIAGVINSDTCEVAFDDGDRMNVPMADMVTPLDNASARDGNKEDDDVDVVTETPAPPDDDDDDDDARLWDAILEEPSSPNDVDAEADRMMMSTEPLHDKNNADLFTEDTPPPKNNATNLLTEEVKIFGGGGGGGGYEGTSGSFLHQAVAGMLSAPVDGGGARGHVTNPRRLLDESSIALGDDGWGYEPGDGDDAGVPRARLRAPLVPSAEPALARQLRMLRSSASAVVDAPPEMRLTQLLYEAATIEQARAHSEITGRAWDVVDDARLFGDDDVGASSWAVAHVDALLELRMRAIAVCRIRYGSTSIEMLRSLLDLARAYADAGLWPQATTHADRATQLIWSLEAASAKKQTQINNDDDFAQVHRVATAIREVFERLETLALNRDGGVPWPEVARALVSSGIPSLAEQPWGVREGSARPTELSEMGSLGPTTSMTWGSAVAFLRAHHAGFSAAVRKIERSVPAHDLALLAFAFDAAAHMEEDNESIAFGVGEKKNGGVASAIGLRTAIVRTPAAASAFAGTGFATWLAKRCKRELLVRASSPTGGGGGGGSSLDWIPLTWEQAASALALTLELDRRGTLAEMRAVAQVIFGRSHAEAGKMAKARSALGSALATIASLDAARREGRVAAGAHAALADVLVAEHSAWERATENRGKEAAEQWLATDEGHRLWRGEVKRLVAEMRVKGTPGLVELTRPEIECRARDVLLVARTQYVIAQEKKKSKKSQARHETRLAAARSHLEAAFRCEVRTYGAHAGNARAALATAALGNLAVVAGDHQEAIAKLGDAVRLMVSASDGKTRAASAGASVQLGRLLRKTKRPAEAAECLAAAAQFYLSVARHAHAEVERHTSAENNASSCRREVASEARGAAARKARSLWLEVAAILSKEDRSDGSTFVIAAHEHIYAASKFADGDDSISAMKALRKVAKLEAAAGRYEVAVAHYLELQAVARRAGVTDIATKALRAVRALRGDTNRRKYYQES